MKSYEDIMEEINAGIMASPNALQQEIDRLQSEVDQIDQEIAQQNHILAQLEPISANFQVEYDIWDTPVSKGLKFVELDKNGDIVRMIGINRAKDFKRGYDITKWKKLKGVIE